MEVRASPHSTVLHLPEVSLLGCSCSAASGREGRLRRGTGRRGGCILQPLRAAGQSGCPRVFLGELGPAPWVSGPQSPSSQSLWPPGTEGPVRRALRGSALPVRAAGSRLRSLKHAARAWPGASSTKALPRGGNPISTPFAPLPPPSGPVASARHDSRVRQGKLCSASATPWQAGCPPQAADGTLLTSPGSQVLGCSPGPRKVPSFCFP